ncbi:PAS domain-containing protein [Rufibacter sp. LB8]|uniref:PAS domain-containing sensor histidine kinase n=1 Tax=Rufibacter sp. LB8 TaxID=2777781 RepID=UPI00178C2BAF|nr:PAS domain-containing protein [Rufibacter sp. LB8]
MNSSPIPATNSDVLSVFRALPGLYLILSPELLIVEASEAYLQATFKDRSIIGHYLFEIFPDNPDALQAQGELNLKQSLEHVLAHKAPHQMPLQRYDVTRSAERGGGFEEKYWLPHNKPVLDTNGQVLYLIHTVEDVTQQQKYEQETERQARQAQENMERFQLLAMATNDVIWDWNLADDTIWWNNGFKTIFGYQTVEKYINSWYGRIHLDDRERVVHGIHDAIDNGKKNWQDEYRFRKADGSYAEVFDRGIIARDDTGRPLRMIGAMLDLTEKNRYAAELQASHARLNQILDALPHMTFTSRPDGYVDYYSQRWYDFLGGTRETLTGWGWEDYIHPEDLDSTISGWRHCLATGTPYMVENRWRAQATGEYRWFLVRGMPVRDSEGAITMWVGSYTDIHDQKKTQLALQESTQHFKFLADSMPQLVWTTDPNGFHDYFNQQWVDYTGYDVETSKGTQMWNDILHPDDQVRTSERWQISLQTGKPYEVEYRFRRAADGEWRWFLGRALPLLDADGKIVRWFGTCTDIEDQKRHEELMEQTNRELRSINEDLDSFVYTASHDLKLPIINMAGIFKELTSHATFHDPDAPLLITMFEKSLTQINATISDLAEIVKVQKSINAQREVVPLQDLVEEVTFSIKDMVKSSNASIKTDFSEADSLVFSRVNLKSIFYNLISNAIKYQSVDRTPEIMLSTEKQDGFVVLTIKDNGMGIDMERHGHKLFQMFKRFHSHVSGSGLGLYIINRIIQKNNGRIEVSSQVGKGTTFQIYFPTVSE